MVNRHTSHFLERFSHSLAMIVPGALTLLILVAFAPAAAAQTAPIERIHIIDRGIYRAETVARDERSEEEGAFNTVRNAHLINDTTAIVGRVGVRFGLRYTAASADGNTELKLITIFPAPGLRDPATGKVSFQSEFTVRPAPGAVHYWEYHFENEWEVVAGLWIFEFWLDRRKLAEQRFCVSDTDLNAATAALMGKCQPGLVHGPR